MPHSVAARATVKGNIVAEDKVELGPEARVEGDITCQNWSSRRARCSAADR